MEHSRFLDCLAADFARLRTVVSMDLTAAVPSCPGWTVADLARHVGEVYLHKTLTMREGADPEPWPPAEIADEDPLVLLDRAYAGLIEEFAARKPEDSSVTWYGPDQSVGFWMRRMAQETVIHRIDAQLATGRPVAPVPADLAIDGIDELLVVHVAYAVSEEGEYFTDILDGSPGRTYTVRTEGADGASWRVRTGPGLFAVESGPGDDAADVTVSGRPTAVLRWMWNRESAGKPTGVTVEGAPEAVEELRRCIVTATQ